MSLSSFIYTQQLRLRQWRLARSFAGRAPDLSEFEPGKVLFVLAGLIGDSVMSLPAITVARTLWPAAKITILGKKHNRELIAASDLFNDFYEFNADPFSLRRSGETRDLEAWLAKQHFDAAVILLGDQFAHLLAGADIPVRVGVRGTPLEGCLTHRYDIGSPRTWGVKERLNAIRCLGHEAENSLPTLEVGTEARISAIERLNKHGLSCERYLVLHPFGSTPRQWWDLENIPEFAAKIKETHNLEVVLVGGPENAGAVPTQSAGQVVNTVGELSIPELLATIDQAELVVTTDSGPFHIAGGLSKNTIGIFRARRPEHAGQYPTATVVFGENEGCLRTCRWDHCQNTPCSQMSEVSVAAVLDAVAVRLAPV